MAPKIVSEHERMLTRQAIMNQTKKLIAIKRGIKTITVDDITQAIGMAKGSFYGYFPSKEACIYEVIEQAYEMDLIQLEAIMKEQISLEEKVEKFVMDIFLGVDGIDRYITSKDYEILLRKLPHESRTRDGSWAEITIKGLMDLFKLERVQVESITMLFDCIRYLTTQAIMSEAVKEESIKTLTKTIASYIRAHSSNLEGADGSSFAPFPMQELLWLGGY